MKKLLIAVFLLVGAMSLTSFRYSDRILKFSMELPADWSLGETGDPEMFVAMSPWENEDDILRENVNMIVTPLEGEGISLQGLYNANIENARMQLSNFRVIKLERLEIGGVEAIKTIYTFDHGQDTIQNIVYLLVREGTMYTITFSTLPDRFEEFNPTFEKIVHSIELW